MEIKPGLPVTIIGCGYVGGRLALHLRKKGCHVTGTTRSQDKAVELEKEGIQPLLLDLTTARGFSRLDNSEVVVLCPAPDESTSHAYHQIYDVGIQRLMNYFYFHKPKKLIYTSSIGIYEEENGGWVDESTPLQGKSLSVQTLIKAEEAVRQSPFDTVIVRLGGIYGPGRLTDRLLEKHKNDMSNRKKYVNLIYIEDVIHGLEYLINKGGPGETYNLVDNEPFLKSTTYQTRRSRQNKRCSNKKLRELGYQFVAPTFNVGYELISKGMVR